MMSSRLPVLLLIGTLAAPWSAARGQSSVLSGPSPEVRQPARPTEASAVLTTGPASVDGTQYRLGPEDALAIVVANMPSMSGPVIVRPDGKIALGLVGEVIASGKTPVQLQAELERRLAVYIRQPRVTVQVTTFRPLGFVYVMGQVVNAGPFPFRNGLGVAEALALAGGTTLAGDLKRVTVTHTDRTHHVVDFSSLDETGKVEGNLPLQPGDVVDVPMKKRLFVTVLGGVKKRGRYEFQEKATLAEAIARADGLSERADPRGSVLLRDGQEHKLDLEALLLRGDTSSDPLLQDGDVLTVRESTYQVYVVGEVIKGGLIPVRDPVDLLTALSLAGGPSKEADMAKALIVHPDQTTEPVDLDRLLKKKDLTRNVQLRENDVLFIPNKKPKRSWTDFLGLAYPFDVLHRVLKGQ